MVQSGRTSSSRRNAYIPLADLSNRPCSPIGQHLSVQDAGDLSSRPVLGHTINGLPIMVKWRESIWDIEDLDLYFRDRVIGRPGAFMIPAQERNQFAEAIKVKNVRDCGSA